MIQRPVLTPQAFSSRENLVELMRRAAHAVRKHENPNNRAAVTPEQYRSYFKFTIVRNPWARVYSWYRNVTRGTLNRNRLGVAADIGLTEFLKRFAGRDALRPQTHWLRDFGGGLPLDYIGSVENLEADFARICEALGKPREGLGHVRNGNTGDYRGHFDAEAAEIVRDTYAEEIELFGYSFDSLDPPKRLVCPGPPATRRSGTAL